VRRRPRPLALYLFTYDQALQDQVTTKTHAGSMCINDAMVQVVVDDIPFGGIGPSDMGHYHGHEGFLTMSKAKSVFSKGKLKFHEGHVPPLRRRHAEMVAEMVDALNAQTPKLG
jgi:coniferyl-aldehyde dehydrogenase